MINDTFITARIHSLREGNVFGRVCLSPRPVQTCSLREAGHAIPIGKRAVGLQLQGLLVKTTTVNNILLVFLTSMSVFHNTQFKEFTTQSRMGYLLNK